METSLYFPRQISSIRTKKDIEAACKILLCNVAQSFELIGEPTIQFVNHEISSGNYSRFVGYPVWEQEIQITNNGNTHDYCLLFHEVDQSLHLYEISPFTKRISSEPIGRQFLISKDGKRIKTIYDDTFLATAKQAKHKLTELIPHLHWEDIYRAEPKILEDGRPIWLITCAYKWLYALDIVRNPAVPYAYYRANRLSREQLIHPMNPPFDNLQDPVKGKDYFAFDYKQSCVRHVTNLMALRFTGAKPNFLL